MKISLIVWSALIAGISAGYPAKRNGQSVEPYTETVSLTVQGKPTTVTHAIEVAYFTDSSHLETIQLTDNLVKNLHSWLDVCPFKRSKRSPPLGPGTLHGPIRLSKCTEGVIKEALQDLKPGGKLFGLIVSLRNYVFDLPGHVLNDPALKQFQEAAAAIPELQSFPAAVRDKAVNTIVLGAQSITEFGQFATQWFVDNSMYLEDPPKEDTHEGCPWGDDVPACENVKCRGGSDGHFYRCRGGAWDGCRCYDIDRNTIWDDQGSLDWLQGQSQTLKEIGAVGQVSRDPNPKCNGMDTKKWTTREAAEIATESFCGNPADLTGSPGDVHENRYGPGTSNELILRISWPKDVAASEVSVDDCNKYMKVIINGCDGDDPNNPANLKYGGTFKHSSGAILEFAPFVGVPNDVCFKRDTRIPNTYVAADAVYSNIEDFCNKQGGKTIRGTIEEFTYNDKPDSLDTVKFTVESGLGYEVKMDDCRKNLHDLAWNCDGGAGNPNDFKWGGIRGIGSVKWTIEPQRTRLMPYPMSHPSWCEYFPTFGGIYFNIGGAGWMSNGLTDIHDRVQKCKGPGSRKQLWQYNDMRNTDNKWEWFAMAYFNINGGTPCLEKALTDAGGDAGVKCTFKVFQVPKGL